MLKPFLFSALILLAAQACAQSPAHDEIREFSDLLYVSAEAVENDSLQRLNMVLPAGDEGFPLLIWIGGGAWSYVDRDMEMNLAHRFAEAGIAVASVGHRLSPAVWRDSALSEGIQHPKHIEDIAAATAWLVRQADTYGYDLDQLYIGGFSSGAHLAALLTVDPSYLAQHNLEPSLFQGVIPISGAYDIQNYYDAFAQGSRPALAESHVRAVFGYGEEDLRLASPTNYLENASVPMLLMTDNSVSHYTQLLEGRLQATDFSAYQVVYCEDLSHADLWYNLGGEEESQYRNRMVSFIFGEQDQP